MRIINSYRCLFDFLQKRKFRKIGRKSKIGQKLLRDNHAKYIIIYKPLHNKLTFIALYGVSLFVSFFMIPFSYFYGDERIEDIQPKESEFKEKVCNSLKYTVSSNLSVKLFLLY